jgi:hypothetical protein
VCLSSICSISCLSCQDWRPSTRPDHRQTTAIKTITVVYVAIRLFQEGIRRGELTFISNRATFPTSVVEVALLSSNSAIGKKNGAEHLSLLHIQACPKVEDCHFVALSWELSISMVQGDPCQLNRTMIICSRGGLRVSELAIFVVISHC